MLGGRNTNLVGLGGWCMVGLGSGDGDVIDEELASGVRFLLGDKYCSGLGLGVGKWPGLWLKLELGVELALVLG